MIQFSQDDSSFGLTPRDFHHPAQSSFSPARKKNRSHAHAFLADHSNNHDLSINNFMMYSQDSSSASFSQDFAERLGHLNVQCSQEHYVEEMFPPPAPKVVQKVEELQIELRSVNPNPFLSPRTHHAEQYFSRPVLHTGMRLPPKIWISAFKERSRYITDYEEVSLLGEGAYSTVIAARHRIDGCLYAIKRIKMRIQSENHFKSLAREVCAYSSLRGHRGLVSYHTSWVEDQQLYMQLELCPLGSLEDLIAKQPGRTSVLRTALLPYPTQTARIPDTQSPRFPDMDRNRSDSYASCVSYVDSSAPEVVSPGSGTPQGVREGLAWLLLQELGSVLHYLHSNGMVHLDIRPANVFMTAAVGYMDPVPLPGQVPFPGSTVPVPGLFQAVTSGTPYSPHKTENIREMVEQRLLDGQYIVKLGDLGHARGLSEQSPLEEGESRYCPRELINSSLPLDLTKADVFSLGASIYELCLGRPLGLGGGSSAADGAQEMEEWHAIRDGVLQFDGKYSMELQELLAQMLAADPDSRPSALQVMTRASRGTGRGSREECDMAALMEENARLREELLRMASGAGSR